MVGVAEGLQREVEGGGGAWTIKRIQSISKSRNRQMVNGKWYNRFDFSKKKKKNVL